MYALIQEGQIVQVGALPRVWNDGTRDWGLGVPGAVTPEQVTALGWLPVTVEPRPDDTATTTWEQRPAALIDGIPTVKWAEVPKSPEWIAAEEAAQVSEQLRTDTTADLVKLKTAIDELQTLLGDNTVVGSIREWRGSVNNTYSRDTMRALADLLINQTQVNRRIARQVLRLAKEMVGDYGDADVGAE